MVTGVQTCALPIWPNWPDLWRDWDLKFLGGTCLGGTDQIDLIYEGIETSSICSLFHCVLSRPNWPDLWRDWDSFYCLHIAIVKPTKLTWFMKGLRPLVSTATLIKFFRPNWPDLWRDWDNRESCSISLVLNTTKLTWFMKGLRQCRDWHSLFFCFCDQIDLIYEGIETTMFHTRWRPQTADQIDLIYEGIETRVQGPRYQLFLPTDQIDLIYEGIETYRYPHGYNHPCRWPNWPDLWRDWD